MILAIFLAVSAAIWIGIYARWQEGRPIIPLARRRPVPWQAQDVLFLFLIGFGFPIGAALAVQMWIGPDAARHAADQESKDAAQQAADQKSKLAHPAEQLLRSGNPGAIAISVTMAVIVAPLIEEFLFRVLLQGWLEALWSRQRRRHPELRAAPISWIPIVLPAALFALWHLRSAKPPLSPPCLTGLFLAQMAGQLLALALAIVILRFAVGATAADLGWKAEELGADAGLGLWALLAVLGPVLTLQFAMVKLVNATGINYALDPVPLFVLALILGVLYHRTHRLAPPLVLHMAFNATSIVLFFASK
jgi:membrane protease YdiL (CAAX protease family)